MGLVLIILLAFVGGIFVHPLFFLLLILVFFFTL